MEVNGRARQEEEVVEDLRELVGELVRAANETAKEAEASAEAATERHGEACDELDAARREIERLEAEREELPNRAYRAGLDEEYTLEDELKERYKNLKPALEALRERVAELEAEIAELVGPNPRGSQYDVMIHQYARVRERYSGAVAPLNALEREVGAILREATGPLAAGEKAWGDTLRGLRDQRDSDPDVMAQSLAKRGVRVTPEPAREAAGSRRRGTV